MAMTAPPIAIYGANGHTGRLVAAELLSRGQEVVLAGRDDAALRAMAGELGSRAHLARLDDPASLRALAESAAVLIHCAGPFSVTGAPVASAAAEAGCHYIDHAVEPHHVKHVFETYQEPARRTGAIMIPGLSFYGGVGDLLAGAVTEGMTGIDRVTVAYAVSGWRMTTGALNTARQLFAETERISFSDGVLRMGYVEPRNVVFPFPPPIGPRTMIAPIPFPEAVTVPRHVPAREVEAMLTARTFEEERVFDSEDADAETRAQTDFTVAVQAIAEHGGRAGQVSGHDLWRAGALASVEAALRLACGEAPAKGGVLSAGEAFPAEPFLRVLERRGAFTVTL
ncbi:saccharopine dehydrogenase NADP-binding domain-containing protein [Actinoallomurus bryophytorum]|uniref:Saccharopine dehydrogenase-like protein n=2 Tax=Actinoallomurus bryophytorum TaxID=1490222 RepID=A0A543CR57_9ACTN|nr:saccharopine dehydrogenase-like protein [Actinoallomurus bryophytorum]